MIMFRLAAIVMLTVLGANSASARTWHVRKDRTGDSTVIQDAVDHAAAGDTIRIGPGRFEEKRPYTSYPPANAEKWTFDVYVAVDVADLTIIGSGSDQTIIGPPAPLWVNPEQPKVICAFSRVQRLVVEDLAMENVFGGIYKEGGALEVRRCRTLGCRVGISTWSEGGTIVEDCRMQDLDYGIIGAYPARNLTVAQCELVTCSASFDHVVGAAVVDCTIDGYSVGCQFANNSTGSVVGCVFTNQSNVGISVISGSVVDVTSNQVSGSAVNLLARSAAVVSGWNNYLSGGWYATIWISRSNIQLHGCQILHVSGPTVLVDAFLYSPTQYQDMTNNYWGTDSAATIAGWIVDGNDDPSVYGVVQFEPFQGQPVSSESTTWGDLKALWR